MDHIELSFVCEDSWGSKLIQWFTHSDYSHVDIITPDGFRVGARMDHPVPVYNPPPYKQSWETGVQKRPMNYGQFTRDTRLLINAPQMADAYAWLDKQMGKPYDKSGLLRSFLLNQGRDVNWRDDHAWWCSELGMAFLEIAIGRKCNSPASRIAPNDLFLYGGAFAKCQLEITPPARPYFFDEPVPIFPAF